jgi:hypothetical protein
MPARECARDNRPNKTSGDLDATAFNALIHGFADRTASIALTASVRAPHVRISIRANRYVFINPATPMLVEPVRLTIRLSDARLRRRKTKLFYPDHRSHSMAYRRCDPRSLEPIVRWHPTKLRPSSPKLLTHTPSPHPRGSHTADRLV